MGFDILAAIIVTILLLLVLCYFFFYKKVYILDDNITYRILEFRPNKHVALHLLHDLNSRTLKLIKQIKNKYKTRLTNRAKQIKRSLLDEVRDTVFAANTQVPDNDSCIEPIELILKNYNPDLLVENDPIFTIGDKTFTMNFKRIAICLRKRNWSFYDFSTLMFVFLHEIAHTGTHPRYLVTDGRRDNHPSMFWRVFKFLLQNAVEFGYIPAIDYSESNFVTYCGIPIQSNPLFDESIQNLV